MTSTPPAAPWILVVDDDKVLQQALGELLTDEGYAARFALNGQDALSILKGSKQLPGLILLDLEMPVMSGWAFLRALEKEQVYDSIPVMVLSAAVFEALPARVSRVMHKPFNLDQLLAEIRSIL